MNALETTAILILIGVNIATLLLFMQHRRLEHMQNPFSKNNEEQGDPFYTHYEVMERFDDLEQKLDKVLQRIGQLKNRESDEERDDQKAKAKARYEVRKGGA